MATKNFFDLLGDDENEDPAQVVVRANSLAAVDGKPAANAANAATKKPAATAAKLPSKPAPPSEAVRDGPRGQYDGSRGGRGGGRGGRGGRGDREGGGPREGGGYRERGSYNNDRNVGSTRDADGFVGGRGSHGDKPVRIENGEGRSYEGGRNRGGRGRGYGEGDERPRRREFDRHSGNPRASFRYETEKRAGSGRANWGTDVDPALIQETVEGVKEEEKPAVEGAVVDEKKPESEPSAEVVVEEGAAEKKEEEEEDNEMTLEEYEKVLEEKRKSLEAAKAAERKVEVDKSFSKMQLVDNKKRDEDIFIKLGADKEKVKREAAEREEKSRKPVSINEFLKPAEGEKYYGPPSNRGRGGRGGRGDRREGGERREGGGRGDRESSRGGFGGGRFGGRGGAGGGASAPKIEDQAQFPTLGGK